MASGSGEKAIKNIKYYILGFTLAVFGILLLWWINQSDVNFCRSVFSGLIRGSRSVEKSIAWEDFQALGMNVAVTYAQLPNDKERQNYREAFIKGSARGFRNAQLHIKEFIRWRIYDNDDEKVVIAADYLRYNKVILFTVSKAPARKLVSVQWKEEE